MSGTGRSGPGGPEAGGRAATRRSGWAQLGRRNQDGPETPVPPAGALPGTPALRAVAVRPTEPAEEHHLGERLSAFVDGELGHDSRDRVQAHLATCPQCLAEADEGRAVKHLLTRTDTPGPSSALMARLMAVGALEEDERPGAADRPRRDDDDLPGGGLPTAWGSPRPEAGGGTLGGSRLNGGSFGRGAGASFGGGALGADAPLPGVDPRAFGRGGSVLRPLMGRRAARPEQSARPEESVRPQPAAASAGPAVLRPAPPRGRRFVFAAAGAFSVAAVTLGGVGGLSAQSEDQHGGTSVSPVGDTGRSGGGPVPMTAKVPVDLPVRPVSANREATPPYALPDRTPSSGLAGLHHENR
ncbi:zf-HC2 domain-containing protein [Kitasatospora sp. CM 4170]|uniref:Anti-sigma factor family protein n=1 Tax=Kitasatospora aburaviensis TaxID=67265 RepID=A0ABW1EUZ8_9ACTN|nr:zf-HC2 domain-containing protein [Kitasatospora sp. CM 4170]WNM47551.1 zf-HC2 domain-containing protein [Kitasatospora sp. CM 4170]